MKRTFLLLSLLSLVPFSMSAMEEQEQAQTPLDKVSNEEFDHLIDKLKKNIQKEEEVQALKKAHEEKQKTIMASCAAQSKDKK